MENTMKMTVTCKDEATKAKYEQLAAKMRGDTEFQTALKYCSSERDVYDLYSSKGYTDLGFKDFCEEFRDTLESLVNVRGTNCELTEDELENVVGGFNFKDVITTALSAIPVAGPIIQGVEKGFEALANGEGTSGFVKHVALGVGIAVVEAIAIGATSGAAIPFIAMGGAAVGTTLHNLI